MRKSADVVILMNINAESYKLLYPTTIDWDAFCAQKPDVPFSDEIIEYLNALSSSLMKDKESRLYPDVVTFGFFCRKGNLLKLKEEYCSGKDIRLGRGVLFHIAPSNVPVNFGYSMVAGLLAGNCNIVRASSKEFAQVSLIVKHMNELADFNEVAKRIAVVRYDRTSDATEGFSAACNVRVIWGGDATIATIRQNALPPRSFDVCFADRYSIALVNPKAVMDASDADMEKLAQNFYNDTYLFDQNACSAPHLVFWKKDAQLEEAKLRFWKTVHDYTEKKYQYQDVMSVDKLTAFYKQAVGMDCVKEETEDNLVMRTELKELPKNIDEFRCACGYFSEYEIDALEEILPIVTIKYQTLAYYGFDPEELKAFVLKYRPVGLDRIVPFGETTAFVLKWDGYNLINTLSRVPNIF